MADERGWPIDGGYRIETYGDQDRVSAGDVAAFWVGEAQLPPAEARRRVAELLMIATHVDAGLVGVLTAFLKRNEQLRMDLWYFRTFVAPGHRKSIVGQSMVRLGYDVLRDRHARGEDTRGAGVIGEVEHPGIKRMFNHAIWPRGFDYVFIGENFRGDHVRVFPFPGVLAPPPPRG